MADSASHNQILIDFLPESYRVESAQRQNKLWRGMVVALFLVMIMVSSFFQYRIRRQLESDLAAAAPLHAEATARSAQLAALQKEIAAAQAEARLITYLRHPWPRTQIFAAVLEPLPETITLSELQLKLETQQAATPTTTRRTGRREENSPSTDEEQLLPPEADLKQLREEIEPHKLVVAIGGVVENVTDLHSYLGRLTMHPLIIKAEIRSVERSGPDAVRSTFRARIVVRPGYGQPGGPEPALENRNSESPDKLAHNSTLPGPIREATASKREYRP